MPKIMPHIGSVFDGVGSLDMPKRESAKTIASEEGYNPALRQPSHDKQG